MKLCEKIRDIEKFKFVIHISCFYITLEQIEEEDIVPTLNSIVGI